MPKKPSFTPRKPTCERFLDSRISESSNSKIILKNFVLFLNFLELFYTIKSNERSEDSYIILADFFCCFFRKSLKNLYKLLMYIQTC